MKWLALPMVTMSNTGGHLDPKSVAQTAKLSFERTTARGDHRAVMAAFLIAYDVPITVYHPRNETKSKILCPLLRVEENFGVMMGLSIPLKLNPSLDELIEDLRPDSNQDHSSLSSQVDFLSSFFKHSRNELNDVQIPSPVQSNLDKELATGLISDETPVTYEHPQ